MQVNVGDLILADTVSMSVLSCTNGSCSIDSSAGSLFSNALQACGGTANNSLHFLASLNCPDSSAPLTVVGNSLVVDGRGHGIVAPNAKNGLYVAGKNIAVQYLTISNVTGGNALFAYNSDGLQVLNSTFNGNGIGVQLYVDSINASAIKISNNQLAANSSYGIKITGDNGYLVNLPSITNNDFSSSGDFALWLEANNVQLSGTDGNTFTNSLNGIYFTGGGISLNALNLANSGIMHTALMGSGAQTVAINSCDFTNNTPANSNQERVAVKLYRVINSQINALTVSSSDVGVKISTDSGVIPNLSMANSSFSRTVVTGVMIESYDATPIGTVRMSGNTFCQPVWVVPGTKIQLAGPVL